MTVAEQKYVQVGWITDDEDAGEFGGVLHDNKTHDNLWMACCFQWGGRKCTPVYVVNDQEAHG